MNNKENKNRLWSNESKINKDFADYLSNKKDYNPKKMDDKTVIYVGMGTCGLGAGAAKTLESINTYLEEKDIAAEVIETGCIGFCSQEPLVDIKLKGKNRLCFHSVRKEKVTEILDEVFSDKIPIENLLGQLEVKGGEVYENIYYLDEHPFFREQHRIALKNCGIIDPLDIDEYIATGGFSSFYDVLKNYSPKKVATTVEKSGLRGRGGGGFLTGLKWKFAANNKADQKYLICNADEGDPGAFMDRALIEGDPFRLIEGMSIAAYAIGATEAIVYIRAEYPLAIERLQIAIDKTNKRGFLGNKIFGTKTGLKIKIKKGAGAFVCGEETALIHSIEGKRGMPKPRPPYPAESGLFGKPTIINNVETFANVAEILKNGAEWFASMGTEKSKGTKVFALSGKVKYAGLVEVEMGTSVRDIIFSIGGGIENGKEFKAAQIGGPSGGCIPAQHLDIAVDYDELKTIGAMMGSGGLVVMDENSCMVDIAKFFMDFIQRESCGKCIPCREGTKKMLEILNALTKSRGTETEMDSLKRMKGMMNLESLAEVIQNSSLCGLGQTAPNPVLSTLHWFKEEYEAHLYERRCPAGVCQELIKYTIDTDKCIGCTLCARKCPTKAIIGVPKGDHFIVEDKCIGCGSCFEACSFDAVKF